MFKLLKKSQQKFNEITQPKVDVYEVIEKIHHEFDTAGEKLLKEAKEVLALDVDIAKGEALHKLGFTKSKTATESQEIILSKKQSKELADKVEYFRTFYPEYKFITEEMVKAICQKYGLLCAEVEHYIGEVPDKNILEIQNFKLRDEDSNKISYGWLELQNSNDYH